MENPSWRRRVCAVAVAAAPFALSPNSISADERGAKAVRTVYDIRNDDVVRQHWELSCGAAAIATLLTFQFSTPTNEKEVVLDLLRRTDPALVQVRMGFSLLDLKRYVAGRGFEAAGYAQLSLDDLMAMAPAIVPLSAFGFDHFVVVRGRRDGRVVFADPAFGNRTLPEEDFQNIWVNRIAFIVFAHGERGAANRMGTPDELMLVPSPGALRNAEESLRMKGEGL